MAQSSEQLQEAKRLYTANKYNETIDLCEQVIKSHKLRDEAYLLKGKSNMELGIFTYAIADFTEAIKFNRKHAESYALRAYCYFRFKEYRLARYDLIEACILDTSNALYHYNLGDVEQHMNKLNEAIKSYTLAIHHNPYYVEAYKNRGHLYLSKREYALAVQDFDSALKYNQNSPELFLYRGMALVPQKKYKEASQMFNRCIKLKPANAAAFYNRGRVKFEVRDFDGAIKDFDTSISYDDQMEIAYFNRALAIAELDKRNKHKACEDLKRAIDLGYTEGVYYLKKFCE